MATTYNAGANVGQPLEIPGTKNVVVINEALDKITAYPGETVVYTANISDDSGASLPASFVVDLEINGTKVITGQALDATVHDPPTKFINLPFVVPALPGNHTVKLAWAEQTI